MQTLSTGRPAGCISVLDQERLEALIETTFGGEQPLHPAARAVLQRLRNAGVIARPELIPPGLVTMNSTLCLAAEQGGHEWEVTLVYPEDHDPDEGCWSVLHPVGAAVFGLCVGDVAEIPHDDGGTMRWKIAAIPFQPEAKGFLTM